MPKDLLQLSLNAAAGQWDIVLESLAEYDRLDTDESYIDKIFISAAGSGKTDILEIMYNKNYILPEETGHDILERIVKHSPADDSDAGVISFLIRTAKVDTSECIDAAVSKGNINGIKKMHEAGADILNRGRSFRMAIFCGKPTVMEYLYTKGAELYTAETLLALKKYNHPLAADCYYRLVEQDGAQSPPARPLNSLQNIARAGEFASVIKDIIEEKRERFQPEDILKKDEEGVCVLSVLTARQELGILFNAKIWYDRQSNALDVYKHLDCFQALDQFDISHAVTEMQHHKLRQNKTSKVRITK